MLIIKKAGARDRKNGWSYDYDTIRKIQMDMTVEYGERLQLEEIDCFLSYLEKNFSIRVTSGDKNETN